MVFHSVGMTKRNEPRDRAQETWQNAFICYSNRVSVPSHKTARNCFGATYPNYDDVARFEYGRRLWAFARNEVAVSSRHWTMRVIRTRDRFQAQRVLLKKSWPRKNRKPRLINVARPRTSLRVAWRGKSRRFLEVFSDRLQRRARIRGGNRGDILPVI